jgi:hypothetical protein
MMGEAITAFLATFDRYTLADIVLAPSAFGVIPSGAPPRPRRPYHRKPQAGPPANETSQTIS